MENTLRLLNQNEKKTSSLFGFTAGQCQKCLRSVQIKNEFIIEANTGDLISALEDISMKNVLKLILSKRGYSQCCLQNFSLKKNDQKFMIIHFSHPIDINISSSETLWGKSFEYLSHIKQTSQHNEDSKCCYFRNNEEILYQNCIGDICE